MRRQREGVLIVAKVVGPLFSQDASGKHGALVYARNPYGLYTRPAPGAAGAPSAEQTAWRNAMAAVYNTWETDAGITEGRRAQWLDFARTWPVRDRWGRTIYLDAARWFVKLGIHRQRAGLGLHLGPPIDPSCAYYPTLTFSQEPWGIVVDASPRPTGDQMICLSRVAAQSTNRNFCPSKRTYVDHLMAANDWPYTVWLNGDLQLAEKRYFFVYRIIDGAGRPSSQQIDYVDAQRDTVGWTAVTDGDTYLNGWAVGVVCGGFETISVFGGAGAKMHGLLGFDFSDVPASAVVSTARIYLYCSTMTVAGDVDDHQGITEWEELQATWNDRLTGVAWGVPGGQSGVDYVAGYEERVNVGVVDTWYSWNVGVMAQDWVDGSNPNNGVWLRIVAATGNVVFWSREYGVAAERPYIKIVFGS